MDQPLAGRRATQALRGQTGVRNPRTTGLCCAGSARSTMTIKPCSGRRFQKSSAEEPASDGARRRPRQRPSRDPRLAISLKIVVIICYQIAMIWFILDLGIGLATFVALAVAFFGKPGAGLRARYRAWGSAVAAPCCFPAGPRGRGNVVPARRAVDLAQAIDYTGDYRQNRADFGAEIKIPP